MEMRPRSAPCRSRRSRYLNTLVGGAGPTTCVSFRASNSGPTIECEELDFDVLEETEEVEEECVLSIFVVLGALVDCAQCLSRIAHPRKRGLLLTCRRATLIMAMRRPATAIHRHHGLFVVVTASRKGDQPG